MNQSKSSILQLWIIFMLVLIFNCNDLAAQEEKGDANKIAIVDQSNIPIPNAKLYDATGNLLGETDEFGVSYQSVQTKYITIKSEGFEEKTIRIRTKGEPVIIELQLINHGYNQGLKIPLGYQSVEKNNISSSVFHVGSEIVEGTSTGSYVQSLIGQIPGLTITAGNGSGAPGDNDASFWVRGLNTLTYSYPLVLVDNIDRNLFDKGGSASGLSNLQISSEEIESITVLKDAAAKAIYGMRGANGVILITTKRGKKEPVRIRFTSSLGVLTPTGMPNYLNSYDHALFSKRSFKI